MLGALHETFVTAITADKRFRTRGASRDEQKMVQVPHVVGHHEQDGCQRSQGNLPGQWYQKQQGGYQRETVGNTGDRVDAALADQFLAGVMRQPGHAVGEDGRQQRFNRPQHGNRKRRTQQRNHAGQRDSRPLIAYSSDIYPIEYIPNFHELEYAVPVQHGKEAVRAVRDLMLKKHTHCLFTIEYRFTAGDPAWISPFYQQDSITLSVSGQPGVDYWDYLRDVDAILRRYKARPHWGKMHFLDTDDVTALYPRAEDFRALRRKLDPKGRFLNDHVRILLG